MKNYIILLIFSIFLFFNCETGNNDNTEVNNYSNDTNIYLLGSNDYWKNGVRYTLNVPKNYNNVETQKIIPSNSKVFVIGTFQVDAENGGYYTRACYWENGVFNTFSTDDSINVNMDRIVVSNGNIYAASFNAYWFIGNTQNRIPSDKSSVYDLFVYNNTLYMAGYNYDNNWTACYWMNNNKFNLSSPSNYYSPMAQSIFIDGGNVYCSGENNGKPLYWINGTLFELSMNSENRYSTNDIIVSNGKTFVFGSFSHRTEGGIVTSCYWEDGILKLLPTGTNMAVKPIVYNGKVYTYDNEGFFGKAKYFINGEEFIVEPSLEYTFVNSIFVYNGDVFISGGYYDSNFQYQSCYWINGAKRINLNHSVKNIFVEQK